MTGLHIEMDNNNRNKIQTNIDINSASLLSIMHQNIICYRQKLHKCIEINKIKNE